jgi:hypothetical protein
MEYSKTYTWVIETSYGVYTERGWVYAGAATSREDAVARCTEFGWEQYRVYNNQTGEIINGQQPVNNTQNRNEV